MCPSSFKLLVFLSNSSFLEPIGGSAPKFSAESTISNLVRKVTTDLTLSCPAQGSPIPSFRFVTSNLLWIKFRTNWKFIAKVFNCNCPWTKFQSWAATEPCLSCSVIPHPSIQVSCQLINQSCYNLQHLLGHLHPSFLLSQEHQVWQDQALIHCLLAVMRKASQFLHAGDLSVTLMKLP